MRDRTSRAKLTKGEVRRRKEREIVVSALGKPPDNIDGRLAEWRLVGDIDRVLQRRPLHASRYYKNVVLLRTALVSVPC